MKEILNGIAVCFIGVSTVLLSVSSTMHTDQIIKLQERIKQLETKAAHPANLTAGGHTPDFLRR
jgi:hypothetical protein